MKVGLVHGILTKYRWWKWCFLDRNSSWIYANNSCL